MDSEVSGLGCQFRPQERSFREGLRSSEHKADYSQQHDARDLSIERDTVLEPLLNALFAANGRFYSPTESRWLDHGHDFLQYYISNGRGFAEAHGLERSAFWCVIPGCSATRRLHSGSGRLPKFHEPVPSNARASLSPAPWIGAVGDVMHEFEVESDTGCDSK